MVRPYSPRGEFALHKDVCALYETRRQLRKTIPEPKDRVWSENSNQLGRCIRTVMRQSPNCDEKSKSV